MSDRLKIGLFGGTFNPPHTAHLKLAEAFMNNYKFDRLYICPVNKPYYKKDENFPVSPQHRYNMCKLAFESICNDKIEVSDMEIRRGGNTYTVDTVNDLLKMYPQAEKIYVLCGTDTIKTLPLWHNSKELFSKAVFVHALRTDVDGCAEQIAVNAGATVENMMFSPIDVSSTSVRNEFISGNSSDNVNKAVSDYIKSNLLYFSDKIYDIDKIKKYAKLHETPKRFIHTLGVAKCAVEMQKETAPQLSENVVEAAALLHDITKMLPSEEHLRIFAKAGIGIAQNEQNIEKVFHSRSGAVVAKDEFNVSDVIYNAIWNHTTGGESMTVLDKIVFIADYIEENRTFEDCVKLRNYYVSKISCASTLAQKLIVLNETMLYAIELTVNELNEKGAVIFENTFKARDAINDETIRYRKVFMER